MELQKAKNLAEELMEKHGLIKNYWTFQFNNRKRSFGVCSYLKKTIYLSSSATELNDEAQVRDIILHEIAHALSPLGAGHGYIWRLKCMEIGCKPQRLCPADVKIADKQWLGTCPKCDRKISRYKRTRVSCGRCDSKYNPEYLFKWERINN